ncbi:MAG: hypothetical protein ACLSH6_09135 [Limosilactobacillus pontis]
MVNPQDSMSLPGLSTLLNGDRTTSVEHLREFANDNHWSLLQAAENVDIANQITSRTRNKIAEFGDLMRNLTKQAEYLNLTDLTEQILEQSGYNKMLTRTRTRGPDSSGEPG